MRFSRHLPRLGAAAITAALVLGLTSCGGDDTSAASGETEPSVAAGSTEASPTATPSATESVDPADLPSFDPETGAINFCTDETKPFTGAAADRFGAEEVLDAYCFMVDFSLTRSLSPLMKPREAGFERRDFAVIDEFMTGFARADWRRWTSDLDTYGEAVYQLMPFNVFISDDKRDYRVVDDGQPLTVGATATPAKTEILTIDGADRLVLRFGLDTKLVTKGSDGEFYHVPITRDLNYTLLPTGDPERPWLIDGWDISTEFKDPGASVDPLPKIG